MHGGQIAARIKFERVGRSKEVGSGCMGDDKKRKKGQLAEFELMRIAKAKFANNAARKERERETKRRNP